MSENSRDRGMDSFFTTRIAMVGWIFVAVIVVSLWARNSPQWSSLLAFVRNGNAAVAVAILGAIVGVGAPPAVGFLVERITSVILLWLHWNLWAYPCVADFGNQLRTQLTPERSPFTCPESKGGLFHVFFYTHADAKVLEWARRRRTQMYASLTAAVAIILGLVTTVLLHSFSPTVAIVSAIVVFFLVYHGYRERKYHEEAIASWVASFGAKVSDDFIGQLSKPVSESAPAATTPVLAVVPGNKSLDASSGTVSRK